ncbi:hypothetical protein BRD17_07515 [Halobacteriales archaeon SW_7_68_16]|nr:MAG: hypothetical protein BRD17_07515 [Halobacteriales archaeon SW_7_68_16]
MPILHVLDHGHPEIDQRFLYPVHDLGMRSNRDPGITRERIPTLSMLYESDGFVAAIDTGSHPVRPEQPRRDQRRAHPWGDEDRRRRKHRQFQRDHPVGGGDQSGRVDRTALTDGVGQYFASAPVVS